MSNLSPEIVAAYIQATVKVFGTWAAELAQEWDPDHMQDLQGVVEAVISRLEDLAASPYGEVQERVNQKFLSHHICV